MGFILGGGVGAEGAGMEVVVNFFCLGSKCPLRNRTVTQMRHPLLAEGRPNCARRTLASTLSALAVAAT